MNYSAYCLNIQSELPLPELLPGDGELPDVQIRYGKVPDSLSDQPYRNRTWEAVPGKFLIRIHKIANYFVRDGREICIERIPGSSDDDVRIFLLGTPFGALLHQRNILALHASGIQTERGAVLFMGPPASGKSTLLAAFVQRGYAMLADDVTGIVQNENGGVQALSAFPGIRVWPDTAEMLQHSLDELLPIRKNLEKYRLPVNRFCRDRLPVHTIYVLNSHFQTDIQLESLAMQDKFTLLLRRTYRKKIICGLELLQSHFNAVATLVKVVKVMQVIRPSTPFLLEELVTMIEADIG